MGTPFAQVTQSTLEYINEILLSLPAIVVPLQGIILTGKLIPCFIAVSIINASLIGDYSQIWQLQF